MNRIGNKELARVLAVRFGLDKAASEEFVRLVFEVVNDGLKNDGQSKVKGLGTFKITSVAPRKSVDVNTGEAIVIEARDKISFTADVSMRNQVNRPFAQFETVVVNDDVVFDEIDNKYADSMSETDGMEDVDRHADEAMTSMDPSMPKVSHADIPESTASELSLEKSSAEPTRTSDETEQVCIVSPTQLAMLNGDERAEEPVAGKQEMATEETSVSEDAHELDETGGLVLSAAQLSALHGVEEVVVPKAQFNSVQEENSELAEIRRQAMTYREGMVRQHRRVKKLMAVGTFILLACLSGMAYLGSQLQKRNNRIEHLEALVFANQTSPSVAKEQLPADAQRAAVSEMADSTVPMPMPKPDSASQTINQNRNGRKAVYQHPVPKDDVSQQESRPAASTERKVTNVTKAKENKKSPEPPKLEVGQNAQFDKDVRVRTGAYRIVGIDQVVTIAAGQTLYSISKAYLGPGMECYVEAVNDGRTEFKAGEKIKIPKLKLKRSQGEK